uniref:BPTI/Kunitz inhibitor domain-containing protein n=1 Tax=Daphnia galeata TaxID=27404 RepID=A0A8J2WEA8_9CRUS|nr:unnamed protein product [Daphnia galeata]
MLAIRSLIVVFILLAVASLFVSAAPAPNRNARSAPGCFLPVSRGVCKGHFGRYYYDSSSRSCQSFVYGGCADNANNFYSLSDCRRTCQN